MLLEEVRNLCIAIERIAPDYGYHVALTGGVLYKEGQRKDVDLILYGIRQQQQDRNSLEESLELLIGFKAVKYAGWLTKGRIGIYDIDLLYPDYKPTVVETVGNWFKPGIGY